MNKFNKVFFMLAFLGVQPNQVYSVNWQELGLYLCTQYNYCMMFQYGLDFAGSQIDNRQLSSDDQRWVIAYAALAAATVVSPILHLQKKREHLQPQFAYQRQRLASVEQGKKEDAKRKKELAILRGKNRIPHFFSDPFGGPVDRIGEMFMPNKRQLFARLDEEISAKNKLLALDKCDQEIKDAQIGVCMSHALIIAPYLVGGGVMCYKALAPHFASKQ